jgi:hypothetical protein
VALPFLGESVLAAIGALGVAVVLGRILLPAFNALAGEALSMAVLAQGPVLAAVLLTRAGAEAFGWSPQQAVGRTIQSGAGAQTKPTVTGVDDDYHYESLHRRIQPLALFAERRPWHRQRAVVRSVPGREADALKAARTVRPGSGGRPFSGIHVAHRYHVASS